MFAREDLPVDALTEAYDLRPWRSVELLPAGKSRHYRVVTDGGEYIFRRSHPSRTSDEVRFEHALVDYLRRNGFPAPRFVPCVGGGTSVAVNGGLYSASVFVKGSQYRAGNVEHLREAARTLARYHQIVVSFESSPPRSREPFLSETLRERLTGTFSPEVIGDFMARYGDHHSRVPDLLASLPHVLRRGEAVLSLLDLLYPDLPKLIIHGGCRRGSTLYRGDRLVAMLDFDSARREARVVDLAIALHDFGKVWGDPGSPSFKVPLDLEVVSRFLDAYQEVNPLEPAEIEALPAVLQARPLKRALGKYRSMIEDRALSPGHTRKTAQEVSRVRWLEDHGRGLREILHGATRGSGARS
ncbi:phosphotransferase [Rubrobacter tropicus]|uniref:Phosphotransferase n=1 Tax=Rubrobacter tropicus TaxID=2653851 RepID=A0A6G8Q5S1_9ACTN|nr:phosphotransferase [Rubrobacter tropicus]QIN81825.1 phosphotransferase [Rubrobacter tropicus]